MKAALSTGSNPLDHLKFMLWSLRSPQTANIWNLPWGGPGKLIASYRELRRSGARTVMCVPVREKPSDLGTASATLGSKLAPAPIPTSDRSKQGNSFWAIPTKWERPRLYRSRMFWDATEATLSFGNYINVWPSSAAI